MEQQKIAIDSSLKYRADIDGLRGIAVLAVVFFHFFPDLFKGGFLGVDIFFVISGFLITSILNYELQNSSFQLLNFYRRRIKRLLPALILVLAITSISGWYIFSQANLYKLGNHIVSAVTFTSNFIFWRESNYFDQSSIIKPLWHLWSLAVEEQFYIIWPLVIFYLWKAKIKNHYCIIFLFIASLAYCFYLQYIDQDQIFYSPLTRSWELFAGSLVSCFHFKLSKKIADLYSCYGLIFLLIAFYFITEEFLYPVTSLLSVIGTVLIICSGEDALVSSHLLKRKALVWIGLISYPLYLWHWPLLVFSKITMATDLSLEFKFLLIFISLLLAWMTFLFIEKPFRNNKVPYGVAILIIGMIFLGSSGIFFKNFVNADSRMPAMLKELMSKNNLNQIYQKDWRDSTCYILKEQDYKTYDKCHDVGNLNSEKSLFLWGDSHAAQLYPGLLKHFGKKYKIIQRTGSACPPLLTAGKENLKYCKINNDSIFESIKALKPSKVILAGRWAIQPWFLLEETINNLKKNGVDQIVIVGPFPFWKLGLPNQLFWEYRNGNSRLVPNRTKNGLDQEVFRVDIEMEKFAKKMNVKYISAVKILCNFDRCLTNVGNTWEKVISYDQSHLTTAASEYFVSQFSNF